MTKEQQQELESIEAFLNESRVKVEKLTIESLSDKGFGNEDFREKLRTKLVTFLSLTINDVSTAVNDAYDLNATSKETMSYRQVRNELISGFNRSLKEEVIIDTY